MPSEATTKSTPFAALFLLFTAGCTAATARETGPEPDRGRDAPPAAVTVKVCPDGSGSYTTIQSAVNAVDTGSTLRLCEATFTENVVINGKTLTLRSIGDGVDTVMSGGGSGTVLFVQGGASVNLVDLTITDGAATGPGGGVTCNGSTMTLDAVILTGNTAARGGGLFAQGCALTIKYSTVSGNTATSMGGGAAIENSSGKVRDTEISDNSAPEGGGLYVWSGTISISDNDFLNNEATTTDETLHGEGGGGAGLFAYGAIPVKNNWFEGNFSAYNAGGMYLYYASAEVSGNTVTDNEAGRDGGGVYMNYASANILENTVTYNVAGDDGGGLRAYRGTSIIEENTFSNNTAGDDGGGVKLSHTEKLLINNVISDNTAVDGGGGVELDNDTTPILACTITGNKAGNGAGIHAIEPFAGLEMQDLIITGNTATVSGGGVSIDSAVYGGTLTHLVIRSNKAPLGGGVYAATAAFDLSNSVINANNGTSSGGGIYLEDTSGTLSQLVVTGNVSPTAGGAGLALEDVGSLSVRNSAIVNNNRGVGVLVNGVGPASWTYNDVHDHVTAFSGMTDPTGTSGNIAVNAKFTSASTYDFTLKSTSALINAGDPATLDADGSRADIGAYGGPGGDWL